jgi:L-lactate dehydrogenase (cytochrome)
MKSDRSLARSVAFPRVINIHDFRRLAKKRLPAVVFAYIDGGAEDEVTLRENVAAFGDVSFRPRNCVAVPSCDLRTTVLGDDIRVCPFCWRPSASAGCSIRKASCTRRAPRMMLAPPTILSTFSGTRLEEVRQGTSGTLWFQLYVPGGRGVAEAHHRPAKAAGYKVLVVTIDTPVVRDARTRFPLRRSAHPAGRCLGKPSLRVAVRHPPTLGASITSPTVGRNVFPNVELPGKGAMPCGDVGILLESTIVTWEDLRWMRDAWQGPIVVKGVHTGR